MKIHHIGYLVDDIESAAREFGKLGFCCGGEISEDLSRGVYILFLDNDGTAVELIQPADKSSPIYRLRKKYRNSPYHICYETDDLEGEIERRTTESAAMLIQPPQPAPAIPGCPNVAFLMNSDIGIIELIEVR